MTVRPLCALMRGWKPRLGSTDESAESTRSRFQRKSRAAASSRRFRAAAASRGLTLIELLVTLTILSVLLGVVGLSVAALEPRPEADVPRRLAEGRATAIRTGAGVTLEFTGGVRVTLRADGSATPARIWDGAAYWRVDPWTGEVRRE